MKRWVLFAVPVLVILSVVVLSLGPKAWSQAPVIHVSHEQPWTTVVYWSDREIEAASPRAERVTLYFRNIADRDYQAVAMTREDTSGKFRGVIPKWYTRPPGFAYYFVSNLASLTARSPEYHVETEFDPIAGDPDGPGIQAGGVAWDIQYRAGQLPNGDTVPSSIDSKVWSPIRSGSSELFPAVNSKVWELRSTGSNPHHGIDLDVDGGTSVYPAMDGVVAFVNPADDNPSGIYMKISHNHDGTLTPAPPDEYTAADLYTHYLHLQQIGTNPATGQQWKKGDSITHDKSLGLSDNTGLSEGDHLDFGFDVYWSSAEAVMPAHYFFASTTGWNHCKDLDFAQAPTVWRDPNLGDTRVKINVYPKGGIDGPVTGVRLYVGSSTPSLEVIMQKDTSDTTGQTWWTTMSGRGYDESYVNYYIRVYRGDVLGYVTRPMKSWNASPGIYYRTYVYTPYLSH